MQSSGGRGAGTGASNVTLVFPVRGLPGLMDSRGLLKGPHGLQSVVEDDCMCRYHRPFP